MAGVAGSWQAVGRLQTSKDEVSSASAEESKTFCDSLNAISVSAAKITINNTVTAQEAIKQSVTFIVS